jgi:predicted phosphodiesterase
LRSILFLTFGICFSLLNFISFNVTSFGSNNTIDQYQVVPESERCGDGQDNDVSGLDENCSIHSFSVGIPATDFNRSKTLRIAVVGDIDSNRGLTTQLEIANHYSAQALIIPGDFEYSNGKEVLSIFQSHGFTKENTDIVVGNHDSGKEVKKWLDNKRTFGQVQFGDKLALFNIDSNIKFDCSSPQFEILKSQIESSRALYKFAVVHEPFVTVKSRHAPNGEFDCYDPVFRAGGIDGVLQAHNHNYQRFNINGLMYGVFGTGTHDTNASLYAIKSQSWENNNCLKCIAGKSGITIIDLHLNENPKHFVGWFIGMEHEILDAFEYISDNEIEPHFFT